MLEKDTIRVVICLPFGYRDYDIGLMSSCPYAVVKTTASLRFDFELSSIGRPFDCLSKVIKVTVT